MRVLIPFGARKIYDVGYVVNLKETSEYKCKNIVKVIDKVFDEKKLELAKWMSQKYFCNLADAIRLLVPPGTTTNVEKVKTKIEKHVYLHESADFSKVKSDKHKKIVEFLKDNISAPKAVLKEMLGVSDSILKTLEKNEVIELRDVEVGRDPFWNKKVEKDIIPALTEEQRRVVESIDINGYSKNLIYGVTGSGKTEVYLRLIRKVLDSGKNAIVLVPEISLTPQITNRFLARFGDVVAILHSGLSLGERYDEWKKIKSNKCRIVIGARSAIFAPLSNIGIIIIDEEHDDSYKSETSPKYDAKEVADYIALTENIPLVMGSATPDIVSYYKALNGEINLFELKNRVSKFGLPNVEIVDMREELANGNKTVFSRKLYYAMKDAIKNKEQIMLFLNRRGYSTFVMCRDCGYVVKCEDCDVSMTYHLDSNKLVCHYCGKTKEVMSTCPSCGSKNIRYFGSGTQKIEVEIKKYFPEASVIRMDVDTTRVKGGHEKILTKFRDEKIDILLGTQMIAKGHDFSNVTLVGILAADSSLNIGDYRANEKTFQLLTQMAGRAGRGSKRGSAIIQTYMPDEFSINAAKEQNYERFYATEINMREKLNYPPFCDIIVSIISGTDEERVKYEANKLYEVLHKQFNVFTPVPAPISKINNEYRWRVLLKEEIDYNKLDIFHELISKFYEQKDNEVKVSVDINPNNML